MYDVRVLYMKFFLFVALSTMAVVSAFADDINDRNTPLHLMQPQYVTPYGIPKESEVKGTIDRVLTYLEKAMPATAVDNRLPQGDFRLTSYEAGVLYSAAICAAANTGDDRYLQFVKQRLGLIATQAEKEASAMAKDPTYDAQMRMVLYPGALDDCGAMASAYLRLNKSDKSTVSKRSDAVIKRYTDFIINKQYRLKDGNFARLRPRYNTVWLDDMYMGVPCLAWYGRTDDAVSQIMLFKDKMWMPEKKLFRHGWVESMSSHPAYHWGRANGWAILTMCEVLDACGKNEVVLSLLREHIDGLCALQDKTGFWHQLLDKPDTYLETSCTAIYCYCIAHAINEGWIDAQTYGAQALLAWNACQTKVNEQGQVEGTCVGTGMGFDPAFYAYRPVHKMAAHGYGPMIWAGSEIIRLLKNTHPKLNDSAVHFYPKEQTTDKPIFSEDAPEQEFLW